MYATIKPGFNYLSISTESKNNEEYISLQLARKLGRKRFSLGRATTQNFNQAFKIGCQIEEYCQSASANNQPIELDKIKQIVTAIRSPHLRVVSNSTDVKPIWDSYVKFHLALGYWSESYIRTHIARISNLLNREGCPLGLDKPSEMLQWFLDGKRSVGTAKERFKLVVAAVDWASKNDLIERPIGIKWRDCLSNLNGKLRAEKKVESESEDKINPFTLEEVHLILEALEKETFSRYKGRHRQYFEYVKFLWLTGCRPSEAIALKWHNVDLKKHRIKFCEGEVMASGKVVKKKGTKTVPYRYFPINSALENLLLSLPKTSDYVFLNAEGNPISQHALNRVWRRLLSKLGIAYRIPYQLRHTMISYHANHGFPIVQLANIVGNSEKVIKESYLKLDISLINVPTIELDSEF